MRSVTVIVKPVGSSCNIACGYCYNRFVSGKSERTVMSHDTLKVLINSFSALADEDVRFIWHGGEPLLAGKDFYNAVIRLQGLAQKKNPRRIKNSIQTNGTRLNPSWIDFLTRNNFGIGISLDGSSKIHNANRVYRSGKGTHKKVMTAINELKERGVNFGVGSVITKANVKDFEGMYRFFRENDIDSFDFSPCAETNRYTGELESYSVNPDDYAEFVIGMFDLWMEEDNPNIKIRHLNNLVRSAVGGDPSLCIFNRRCINILSVDYNGDLSFCGRYMGIEEMCVGNILEDSLENLLVSQKYLKLKEKLSYVREECENCEVENTCRGGCVYHSYNHNGEINSPNYFCKSAKRVIPHVRKRVTDTLGEGKNDE